MNTLQINTFLSKYSCFLGTFSRDFLPRKYIRKRPCALIVNTDESTKPGEHWISLFLTKSNKAEYFDSFGFYPLHKEIYKFLEINRIKTLVYNTEQLQDYSSKTCGAYCVLFVKFRCLNLSFCDVINLFSTNRINNDLKASLSLLL